MAVETEGQSKHAVSDGTWDASCQGRSGCSSVSLVMCICEALLAILFNFGSCLSGQGVPGSPVEAISSCQGQRASHFRSVDPNDHVKGETFSSAMDTQPSHGSRSHQFQTPKVAVLTREVCFLLDRGMIEIVDPVIQKKRFYKT